MPIDKDRPVQPGFEDAETKYNDFMLKMTPPSTFGDAQRRYMDGSPSIMTSFEVLGMVALTLEKQRVIAEVADTRLDFGAIVTNLE